MATATDGLRRAWLLLDARRRIKLAVVFAAVFAGYITLAWISLWYLSADSGVAVFWPASGFAAGVAVVLTRPARLPIALAVATATIAANLTTRTSMPAILTFAAGNALECLLFVWVYTVLSRGRTQLGSFSSVIAFLFSAVAAVAITAIPAAVALHQIPGTDASIFAIWVKWIEVDALGIVSVAPALILLPSFIKSRPEPRAVIEGVIAVAVAIYATRIAFRLDPSQMLNLTPATVILPIYIWIASRTPQYFAAIGVLLFSLTLTMGALDGAASFGDPTLGLEQRLARAQVAVMTSGLALLTLSSIFAREREIVAALQSTDQRLRLALDAARMWAFDRDVATGIVHRTGKTIESLGLSAVGSVQSYIQALHPDDRERFEQDRAALTPDAHDISRYRIISPDGQMRIIEQTARGIFDKQGQLLRYVGICLDVTDREASRQALEDRERQLREALEAGRVFAFSYDAMNGTVSRSDNAAAILGIPMEQARNNRPFLQDWLEERKAAAIAPDTVTPVPVDAFTRAVLRFRRPDGNSLWLEIAASAEYAPDGKLLFNRGLMRDVTELHLADIRRAQLIDELDHRVKNDLNRILAVIRLSREGHSDLEQFIGGLERRIMSMSKIQERLSTSKWSGVGVAALVNDEIEPFRTAGNCRLSGVDVVLEPKAAQAFSFTVHELATNASKYGALSHGGGTVDVSWQVADKPGSPRRLDLVWRETCAHTVAPPKRESYGLLAIRSIIEWEVPGARVDVAFEPLGLVCRIAMPLIPPRENPGPNIDTGPSDDELYGKGTPLRTERLLT